MATTSTHIETPRPAHPRASAGEQSYLRTLRLLRGMTQQALAAEANTTRRTICRVEAGSQKPSLDMATRISAALGLDVGAVFNFNDSPKPEPLKGVNQGDSGRLKAGGGASHTVTSSTNAN